MIEELKKHITELKDPPYAIIMNAKNFRILSAKGSQCLVWLPNYKSVYGIPIHIDENYPLKAVTKQEFKDLYKASI